MTGRKGSFSVAVGGVGMWVTGCSFGAVGNALCRTWESRTLAFPCAVNGVSTTSVQFPVSPNCSWNDL